MKTLHLYFIALLTAFGVAARGDNMRWLTLRDGLPGMSVTTFCQDPSGKMWIGTSNGVALYNGISFRNYELPHMADGQTSFCHELTLDREGNLWAATKSGVYRLRRYEEQFQQVIPEQDLTECIVCVGDTVYVGGRSGLFAIDPQDRVHNVDINENGIQENSSVRCLRQTADKIWLTLRHKLLSIDKHSGQRRFYPLNQPSGLSRFDVVGDSLYVGTKNNGLFVLNTETGTSRRVETISNVVNDVRSIGGGQLCVASDGGGAYLLDARTERVEKYFSNREPEGGGLPTDAVYAYLRTPEGVDWIGMYQSGLSLSSHAYPVFMPYECGPFSTQGMKVTATLKDGSRRLIAVKGGVWLVDSDAQTYRFIDTSADHLLHIMSLCRYHDAYYIGSFDGGLLRLDIGTQQLSRLRDCQQLMWASVMDMAVSPTDQLWAVTSEGIFIIDDQQVVKNYTEKNSKLLPSVHSLLFDQTGNAWIGSTSGLCLFLAKEQQFKTGDFPSGFFNNKPRLIFTRMGDSIYARSPISIYHTDALMTHFGEVSLPEGVLGEKCFDFMPDADGVYYVVTEKGLFRIDAGRQTLLHLTASWGIWGDIVSTGTLGVDDRHVWVATNEGLMVADKHCFSADSLAALSVPIEAEYVLTGQTRLSNGQLLKVNDQHELWLGWNLVAQKLVLTPAVIDYGLHHGDIYEYRVDKGQWQRGILGQPIQLVGLWPGKHTLQVRLSGLEGSTVAYTIYVYPTWLFYLEVALLVIALALFLWWRSWRRRTKLLLQEHVATEDALIEEMTTPPDIPEGEEYLTDAIGTPSSSGKQENVKYSKSRVNEKELARLFRQVEDYVLEKKPYLNNDSKMSDIAVAIGVSPSLLSQVFTLYAKEPYYDYINKYRLEEFKRLIHEGKHKQFTITALSEQCGFKKTSFFSTFRKVEGTTPTEWIQKQQ